MSSAVVHGNTVYLAGLTADDSKADVKGQTKQILDKIDALLEKAGTDKCKVLSANIWLTDIGTWGQMNEVWDAWVSPGNTPARATVEAKLAIRRSRSRSWCRRDLRPLAVHPDVARDPTTRRADEGAPFLLVLSSRAQRGIDPAAHRSLAALGMTDFVVSVIGPRILPGFRMFSGRAPA